MNEQSITILSAIIGSGLITYLLNWRLRKANIVKIQAEIIKMKLDAFRDINQALFQEREYQQKICDDLKRTVNEMEKENAKLADKRDKLQSKVDKLNLNVDNVN